MSNPGKGFSNTKDTIRKNITNHLRSKISVQTNQTEIQYPNNNIIFQESYCPNTSNEQYHSPSIIQIKNTKILVWFAGNYEGHFNHIKLSYSTITTNQWSKPKLICHVQFHSIQNPVLYYHQSTSTLFLFASMFPSKKGQFNSQLIYQSSKLLDLENINNMKWSQPQPLNNQLYGFLTKHKPNPINPNLIVLPVYHSNKDNKNDYSGLLWCNVSNQTISSTKFTSIPNTKQLVQPCIVPINDNESDNQSDIYYTFFRTRMKPKHPLTYMVAINKMTKYSNQPISTPLINNNSGFDAIHLTEPKSTMLIIFNEGIKFQDRHRLSLAISYDLGKTIKNIINIEPSLTLSKNTSSTVTENTMWKDAEFSYPSITQNNNNQIVLSYTYNRETIKTVSFDINQMI
jgi:predicted neuraminidase